VLINLLNNAFKFTPKGFIELNLSWQENQLKFVVNDSGAGLTQEKQKEIFIPHYRDTEVSTHFGVSLVVSHHLVELMKGKLQVKSLPQLGATFIGVVEAASVEFSLKPIDNTEALIEQPLKERVTKILIVDENVDIRNLLRIYLEADNYEVVNASNSSEAVFVAWHTRPDLIILAMQLTTKDGYSVVKELRGQQFTKPIIALLDPKNDNKDNALKVGCDFCLSKPVWKETLLTTVKQLLKPI
jgi:CheY-like chemotaxis protein